MLLSPGALGRQVEEAVRSRQANDTISLHELTEKTRLLQLVENRRMSSIYSENLEAIIYVVRTYDRLRQPGMPLHKVKDEDIFCSQSNHTGIIRVSKRTWARYEKVSHTCMPVPVPRSMHPSICDHACQCLHAVSE